MLRVCQKDPAKLRLNSIYRTIIIIKYQIDKFTISRKIGLNAQSTSVFNISITLYYNNEQKE